MRRLLLAAVLAALMVMASAGAAFAGEVTGSGKGGPPTASEPGVTGAVDKGNSNCLFSGLEDFDGPATVEPGTVQNWGHTKDAPVVLDSVGASWVLLDFDGPGGEDPHVDGCNPHVGGEA
jgi:hypothetical protein